jgi:hypothetical protein
MGAAFLYFEALNLEDILGLFVPLFFDGLPLKSKGTGDDDAADDDYDDSDDDSDADDDDDDNCDKVH